MFPTPTSMFLTSGIGVHRHQLTSFEVALRDADIEQQNLTLARWPRAKGANMAKVFSNISMFRRT